MKKVREVTQEQAANVEIGYTAQVGNKHYIADYPAVVDDEWDADEYNEKVGNMKRLRTVAQAVAREALPAKTDRPVRITVFFGNESGGGDVDYAATRTENGRVNVKLI